jgi:hypothetical protein
VVLRSSGLGVVNWPVLKVFLPILGEAPLE